MSPNWTLAQIMSHATQSLGNRVDITLSDASFYANEAAREVWDALPHDLQEGFAVSSTTSGEDKIAFPTDYQEFIALSDLSTGAYPVLLNPLNIDQLDSWGTAKARPTHYGLFNDWLELRPSPDSSYSLMLRYRKRFSDITNLTEAPSVATRYRRAVFLKTKELLAENVVQDSEGAALARNAYISYMNSQVPDAALKVRTQHTLGLSLGRSRGEKLNATKLNFDRSDS